jgi:chloramphenicol-sensitive protein RarD
MNRGVLYALGAYLCWGLLPIFWKALAGVPALEILAHRMVWALAVMLVLLGARRRWVWLREALRSPRVVLTFLTTSLLLSLNWFIYIWAVNAGHIVETSLGYFMNPLVNVLLGVLFLKERLRPVQVVAIVIAVAGVLYMTYSYGALPWISLSLAFSFALYGLLRKTASLGSLEGLALETFLMFLPALGYLLYLEQAGQGAFGHSAPTTSLLLGRPGHGGAATALCLRRPPHHPHDAGAAPVSGADAAVSDRRHALSREARRGPGGGLLPDLAGSGTLYRRQRPARAPR